MLLMSRLLLSLFFMSQMIHLTIGAITMHTNSELAEFKTTDPFRIAFDYYNVTGMLVIPEFHSNVDCELQKKPLPGETISGMNILPENVTSIILVFEFTKTRGHGCKTIQQLDKTLDTYKKWVVGRGYPPVRGLLFLKGGLYKVSAAFDSFYDGYLSDTPIAVTSHTDLQLISDTLKKLKFPAMATLTQEKSVWSKYMGSPLFQIFIWTFFAINLIFLLHGLGSVLYVWLFGSLEADLRTLAFIIGFVSVVLGLITIPSDFSKLSCRILSQLDTILFTISFYFVLVIWCSIKFGQKIEGRIRILRVVIHLSFIMQLTMRIVSLTMVVVDYYDTNVDGYRFMYDKSNYILISLQLLTATIFIYSSVVFYLGMKGCDNGSSRNALARLAIISTASFAAVLIGTIDTFLALNIEWSVYANKLIARRAYKIIGLTIQSAVLLYILGVRMPNYGKTSSETIIVSPLFAYRLLWSEIKARLFNKVGDKHKSSISSTDSITTLYPENQNISHV